MPGALLRTLPRSMPASATRGAPRVRAASQRARGCSPSKSPLPVIQRETDTRELINHCTRSHMHKTRTWPGSVHTCHAQLVKCPQAKNPKPPRVRCAPLPLQRRPALLVRSAQGATRPRARPAPAAAPRATHLAALCAAPTSVSTRPRAPAVRPREKHARATAHVLEMSQAGCCAGRPTLCVNLGMTRAPSPHPRDPQTRARPARSARAAPRPRARRAPPAAPRATRPAAPNAT